MIQRSIRLPLVGLVLALITGCSVAGTSNPNESFGTPSQLGGPPGTTLLQRLGSSQSPRSASIPKDFKGLYVSDAGIDGVWLLKPPKYDAVGELTDGMYLADGLWVDRAKNLYVANVDGQNVTEYAPGASSPTCTYSGGLVDPTNVKTNRAGQVFVIDWGVPQLTGAIDVYKQCQNAVVRKYNFNQKYSERPSDVVFDSAGNMFVTYLVDDKNGHEKGLLEVFKGQSMKPKRLGATLTFPGGLLIDAHGNLIAADQGVQGESNGAVDIIAPPYSSAKPLISGLDQPVWLSLNRTERLLFVSSFDFKNPTVWIFDYPSGKLEMTLGTQNGLQTPIGVAAAPDDTR
jgi:sugar lactone lactonase YvrE